MDHQTAYARSEHLLQLAQVGDREALGALLKLYRSHLSYLARRQLGSQLQVKVDASDVAQDACLEAHRHFGQFQGTTDAEFGAWMRKILAGLLANSVRRYRGTQRRDVRRERPLAYDTIDSSQVVARQQTARDETPSQQAVKRETSRELESAINELPPQYQQVIDLRSLEGLTFVEVAEQMGKSQDSVEKLWRRAIAALRKTLRHVPGVLT
jgi:RNA polymerase sigma-70 factor, ECF subfamily